MSIANRLLAAAAAMVALALGAQQQETPLLVGIAEVCTASAVSVPDACVRAVRKAGHVPVVVCRTAKPSDLERIVRQLDLLLLPGGEDVSPSRYGAKPSPVLGKVNAERDEFESQVLQSAVRHEVPIVGICRGVQHLNVFFGGTLYQDLPSELGAGYTVEHRSGKPTRRHKITIAAASRLAKACGVESATVNSSHHQAVKALAPGMSVTALAADGVVEAIESGWYPASGIQFHPERLSADEADPVWERFFSNLAGFAGRKPTLAAARRPIGIVASGDDGFESLERFLTLDEFDNATGEMKPDGVPDFSGEDFVLLCDFANGPYDGRYADAGKADFLAELVVRGAQFVLGSENHDPAKAVVIVPGAAVAPGVERVKAMARPGNAVMAATAAECYRSLRQAGHLNPDGAQRGARRVRAFITEGKNGPLADSVKYGRERGCRDLGTAVVPFAPEKLPVAIRGNLRQRFPACAKELGL